MDYFGRHQGGERALLVHLDIGTAPQRDVEEFRLLARSAGADVIDLIRGSRAKPDARLFIGSGKADEIAARVQAEEIQVVIFDHALSPAQERNLEKVLQCQVLDRTGLILDIFAQRARTFEGKLQVELAQLDHLSTRLVRGWTHLERQKGGIGLRGPGETQLETDRRLLRNRVMQLKEKLEKVRQTRSQGRAARQKADVPTVSLVGYTNAGKSTLFNRLAGSEVYAADQLFATLDPTLRRLHWPGIGPMVLVDTVGFVRDLPHELVDAFRATLEETLEADLLLHVIDSHSPDKLDQIAAVEQVLKDIQNPVPTLRVYNKIDQSQELPRLTELEPGHPDRVYVSAHTGQGMDLLRQAVQVCLSGTLDRFELHLPVNSGKLRHELYRLNVVEKEQQQDDGSQLVSVHLPPQRLAALLHRCGVAADTVLAAADCSRLQREPEPFETALATAASRPKLDDSIPDDLNPSDLLPDEPLPDEPLSDAAVTDHSPLDDSKL